MSYSELANSAQTMVTKTSSLCSSACRSQSPHEAVDKGAESAASPRRASKTRTGRRRMMPARVRHAWFKYRTWLQAVVFGRGTLSVLHRPRAVA